MTFLLNCFFYFLVYSSPPTFNTEIHSMAQNKITKAFVNLLQDMWNFKCKTNSSSMSNNGIADPSNFRLSITKFAPKFSGFDQHDSQEFLQYALEGFHTELNRVKTKADVKKSTNVESNNDNSPSMLKDKNENVSKCSAVDYNCDSVNGGNDINNNESATSLTQDFETSEGDGLLNGECDIKSKIEITSSEEQTREKIKPKTYEDILANNKLSGEEKGRQCLEVYLLKDNSFITDLFLGQFRSTLRCCVCNHESITFEPFWLISVPIPSSKDWKSDTRKTIIDCMEEFLKVEVLDDDEKPTCEKCKERRKCKKWYSVERWPKILVIHFKRFAPAGSYRAKINCIVEVPLSNLNFRYEHI